MQSDPPSPQKIYKEFFEAVKIAVAALLKGNYAGVDDTYTSGMRLSGKIMADVSADTCYRIWRTKAGPTPWNQSLMITFHEKGNLQLCKNYRTICHICRSSKCLPKVILNLKIIPE